MPPDVSAAIVVHASSHDAPPTIAVHGPRTRTYRFERSGLRWALGVQLRVGHARSVLGVPLASLANGQVDLSELWPCDHLRDALANAKTMSRCLSLLETEIASRIALGDHTERTSRIVERAAEALDSEPSLGITRIARDLGISARQLRRRFHDVVGVGPKEYAATRRFQRAVDALALGRPLAHVALEAGYYDQSHMNLDFRARAGLSPKAWNAARE
jgi:AraC-like DNA-binding protein